ncbi:hypothetical protein [Methanobrevibacter sp.]|uniref:transglutaminase domain-containing protein n=1 Tax=Methanobrevibacter sp. TaxID=66852 RepID=UPI00388F94D8
MSKWISSENLYNMAKDIKRYVENNGKIPYKFSYGGIEFTFNEMQDLMVYAVLYRNVGVKAETHKWCQNAHGDSINENIYTNDFLDQCKRVRNYILTNNQVPNYVTTVKSKKRVNIDLFTYCMAKVVVWYHEHGGELPNYCNYDSRALSGKGSQSTNYSQDILNYFSNKFGRPSSIDDALAKIKGRGYGYYYDDVYSNKQSIDRMRNGQGVNCTDACHVFWHIGKALGYDVRAIHVMCRGGDGHVRLQFYKSQYGWFNRDPAAVLDGECVECIWCGNGEYRATNPQWFLNNVNR